jgi:hypothetical protein
MLEINKIEFRLKRNYSTLQSEILIFQTKPVPWSVTEMVLWFSHECQKIISGFQVNLHSSVNKVSGYNFDDQFLISVRGSNCSLLPHIQTGCETQPASMPMKTGVGVGEGESFLGG